LNYLSILSPLIPLYAEEAWHFTPQFLKREDAVYKLGWFEPQTQWYREDLNEEMQTLESLKETGLRILEQARQKQYIPCITTDFRLLGNPLQADLFITAPESSEAINLLQKYGGYALDWINCRL
jgi:leucyl-tRNA synthetase